MTKSQRPVLLEAENVSKNFVQRSAGRHAVVRAVTGVSLRVHAGETLGIVGESGCGKSTLGRCLVRLTDLSGGRVIFEGTDITTMSRRRLRPMRRRLQWIFQDPYASLNPRRRVGRIVAEPMRIHRVSKRAETDARVAELFELVHLDPSWMDRYPHEFSGGQRQRIGIARALALNPSVLVADEPVSALDVSVQAQVLNLLQELQSQLSLTYVFIAHDLGVGEHVSDRVGVMYLGELVELADASAIYSAPMHPYTEVLLSSVPQVDSEVRPKRERIIVTGDVPNPINKPPGCPFHPRCPAAQARCQTEHPVLTELLPGRFVSCHYPANLVAAAKLAANTVAPTSPG
ncbi:MAG: ABC transporter ATP-binding protein [Nocardioidaceae bacterium]